MTTRIPTPPDARTVIVGVDTHTHVHVAVAIDSWVRVSACPSRRDRHRLQAAQCPWAPRMSVISWL